MKTISASIALVMSTLALASLATAKPGQGHGHPNSKVKYIVLLSIDGLHQKDLAAWVAANPKSTLARLANHGIQFSNAQTSKPSDSFPGLIAQLTGGSPVTTGVW